MEYAKLYYVHNRGRIAKKASVEGHPDKLTEQLYAWQVELSKDGDPTTTTVCVVFNGKYRSHVGPFDNYRKAALRRAGVDLPGLPSTENMRKP